MPLPLTATRRWIDRHATTLAGIAIVLAMSISLAWQTADWLRLLRTPPGIDAFDAPRNAPTPLTQGLELLFGSSTLDGDAPPPATSLRLTLLGSFVHSDPQRSSAIIRQEGSEAQRYGIDSEVANGVRLHAVYADHVELLRNGRRESLAFPHSQSGGDNLSPVQYDAAPDNLDQLDELEAGNLEQLRERMDALREQMEAAGTLPPDAEPTDQTTEGH
ncbi:type II secretion system protein N [Pseudomonas benzenivorans]|uniref:Type II secretion system protein N n=1 Tax=Pseudomonas benzenivorans TaxID=556533 RepID=A0ABZ0PZN1_9PSED|nr:type II secretion system protein N [Pseudomonas benzenivorans]WPC06672.1 type II secretion system protein N [Pseudomonas benzenivorans]